MIKLFDKINNILFEFTDIKVYTVVIEDKIVFRDMIRNIINEIQCDSGNYILSENNKIINFKRNAELITDIFSIDINAKNIQTKLISELKEIARFDFLETKEILTRIELFLDELFFKSEQIIEKRNDVSIDDLLKIAGVLIKESDDLCDKIIEYIDLLTKYIDKKLFIFINLSKYLEKDEFERILYNIKVRNLNVINIESDSFEQIYKNEYNKVFIIDKDLCII